MTTYQDQDRVVLNAGVEQTKYSDPVQYRNHLLDQYKLYLEFADRISARRQQANTFFLAVNTGIISAMGISDPGGYGSLRSKFHVIIAMAGMLLCFVWYRLVRSYRDLNSGKFLVVHEIEENLPLKPYAAEWKRLGEGKNSDLYLPFSHIEMNVPWVFFILYFILATMLVVKQVGVG